MWKRGDALEDGEQDEDGDNKAEIFVCVISMLQEDT